MGSHLEQNPAHPEERLSEAPKAHSRRLVSKDPSLRDHHHTRVSAESCVRGMPASAPRRAALITGQCGLTLQV